MSTDNSLDRAKSALSSLGVEFMCEQNYVGGHTAIDEVPDDDEGYDRLGQVARGEYVDKPFFDQVELPFSPEEWCDLQMQGGDHYTGGSNWGDAVLEILYHSMRQGGGWIKIQKLAELAELWRRRSEPAEDLPNFHALGDLETVKDSWTTLNPWQKAATVWHLTKDHYIHNKPGVIDALNPDFEDTLRLLSKSLDGLWMDALMFASNKSVPQSQTDAHRRMLTYKLLPHLAELRKKVDELELPPIIGYAILENETGEFAYNGFGYCMYYARGEAENMLASWAKNVEERKASSDEEEEGTDASPKPGIMEMYRVQQVRISVEKGLELIDEKAPS